MTITVSQKLNTCSYSTEFGATSSSTETTVDVTYTVNKVINFDGSSVTAEYEVTVGGVKALSPYRFTFKYSGSGNPMDQAEDSLKSFLES